MKDSQDLDKHFEAHSFDIRFVQLLLDQLFDTGEERHRPQHVHLVQFVHVYCCILSLVEFCEQISQKAYLTVEKWWNFRHASFFDFGQTFLILAVPACLGSTTLVTH